MNYRWPIGFFFALVAIPFGAVWFLTEGPKTLDRLDPTYSVTRVGGVMENDLGLEIRDITFTKRHECQSDGVIYLSGTYSEDRNNSEVLMLAEQGVLDNPLVLKPIVSAGQSFEVPRMQVIVSKGLLAKLTKFRFMIPCKRRFVGDIRAYTNSVVLN